MNIYIITILYGDGRKYIEQHNGSLDTALAISNNIVSASNGSVADGIILEAKDSFGTLNLAERARFYQYGQEKKYFVIDALNQKHYGPFDSRASCRAFQKQAELDPYLCVIRETRSDYSIFIGKFVPS